MTDRETAIRVAGIAKSYGPLLAVDDVSFDVYRGEVFVLLGPNGAGKTTTVEILEGLRRADAGGVSVLGSRPGARSIAGRVGVMPQDSDLHNGIRTEEAVRLFAAFYDRPDDPERLIDELGLGRVRRTNYRRLSGGEKQRLSLALALVGRPDVAFLDEPTSGMDVEGRARVWSVVTELRERGAATVVTTHLLDEAERFADRVAILSRGRLVALGSPGELAAGLAANVTFTTSAPVDAGALGAELGENVSLRPDGRYSVDGSPTPELVAALTAWLHGRGVLIRRLDTGPRSLEDVYLELTR